MNRVARLLEKSIASTLDPNMEEIRLNEIRGMPKVAKRLGAQALHTLAVHFPEVAYSRLEALAEKRGYQYLGHGVDASVYLKEKTVIKVHRASLEMDQAEKQDEKSHRETIAMIAANFLGATVLPQSMMIEAHPLGGSHNAVQTMQPYCSYDSSQQLFTPNFPTVDLATLECWHYCYPEIQDELSRFVVGATNMYKDTGFLPDTNGQQNLVVGINTCELGASEQLYLLDTCLIGPEHRSVQQTILQQISTLDSELKSLA